MEVLVLVCPPELDRAAAARVCQNAGPCGRVSTAECTSLSDVRAVVDALALNTVFHLRTETGRCLVPVRDVLCSYVRGHKFRLRLRSGDEVESITTRRPFLENIAALMDSGRFVQCDRGCVVSVRDVRRAELGKLVLTDGSAWNISRGKSRDVWAALDAV